MIDDIRHAIHIEKRKLLASVSPDRGAALANEAVTLRHSFKREQVEQMLRVEIARFRWNDMMREYRDIPDAQMLRKYMAGQLEGPFRIDGVAVYEVNALPGQGWRVINPMAKVA